MTKLLERAVAEAEKLTSAEQETLASLMLSEIASERRWDEAFASSKDVLGRLADEALREYRRGQTKPLEDDRDFTHD